MDVFNVIINSCTSCRFVPRLRPGLPANFFWCDTTIEQTKRLVLNVGSGWSSDIPTRLYDQFSMIAKAESELTVTLHWQDVDLQSHSIVLGENIGPDWTEMEPVDLTAGSSGWADKDAIKLWLEFSSPSHIPSTDVRIGWIRLTE